MKLSDLVIIMLLPNTIAKYFKSLKRKSTRTYQNLDNQQSKLPPDEMPEVAPIESKSRSNETVDIFQAREEHFVSPSRFRPGGPHDLTVDDAGAPVWKTSGYHGWFLFGPDISVEDGIYRVKAIAKVAGDSNTHGYCDIFDRSNSPSALASKRFRENPEFYVRVYHTNSLECRFLTHGETLSVHGLIIEPILLESESVSTEELCSLIERLIAAAAEPAALYRVTDRLVDVGEEEKAKQYRSSYRMQTTTGICQPEIISRLKTLHGPISDMTDNIIAKDVSRDRLFHIAFGQPYTVFDAMDSSEHSREQLVIRGYQPQFVMATRMHRDSGEPARLWHHRSARIDGSKQRLREIPLFERAADIDRSYETAIARGMGFPAYCPVSGVFLRSHHGFLIQWAHKPFIFYRFEGVETFFVCTGANSDARMFLYMPRSQTILWISDYRFRHYVAEDLVRSLIFNMLINSNETVKYLKSETRPAAVLGADNYGHYFWIDMSGMQFAVENDLHRNLAAIVKAPHQYGVVEEIFPEIAALPIHDCTVDEAFKVCLVQGYIPVHFTDMALSTAFVERLRAVAQERSDPERHPPLDVLRPLLWVNVRAHNKVWSDQVNGHIQLFKSLASEYGHISVLIDGTPDCSEIYRQIEAECHGFATIYNGLDFTLYDKMVWAMKADAYLCVIGTGLIICHSIAGARGIAHGNREHMTQLEFWDQIQPGSSRPSAPNMNDITDLGEVDLQQNYALDWRVLDKLMKSHLASRYDSPES